MFAGGPAKLKEVFTVDAMIAPANRSPETGYIPVQGHMNSRQTIKVKRLSSSILEKVAQGDQAAVGQCLDQYGDLIWSLARRFLGASSEAEDAVQEIFIEIWSSAGRYRPDAGSEVTFIATIARRRLIDRLRKHSRTPDSELYDEGIASQNPDPVNRITENVEVHNVVQILEGMSEEHREILSMSIYHGYSHSEIADQLNMPLGTVKTRVRRGLMHIREQLKIDPEDIGENAS
jgi:RNA polymerase sigma-70 factor (ECF subfamily)